MALLFLASFFIQVYRLVSRPSLCLSNNNLHFGRYDTTLCFATCSAHFIAAYSFAVDRCEWRIFEDLVLRVSHGSSCLNSDMAASPACLPAPQEIGTYLLLIIYPTHLLLIIHPAHRIPALPALRKDSLARIKEPLTAHIIIITCVPDRAVHGIVRHLFREVDVENFDNRCLHDEGAAEVDVDGKLGARDAGGDGGDDGGGDGGVGVGEWEGAGQGVVG